MIEFSVGPIELDGRLQTAHDAILKVVARFAVRLESTLWYEEVDFCVLEFLRDALRWRDRVFTTEEPFVYASAESDEPWLLRATRGVSGRWQFESPSALFRDSTGASNEEVEAAISRLAVALSATIPDREGVVRLLQNSRANEDLVAELKAHPSTRP